MAHVLFFFGWLVSQSGIVPVVPIFDPLPFTVLTLVVSPEAASADSDSTSTTSQSADR
jgi:uncharacterized membrane protein